ncbi:MAG TPA: hypothetical protein VJ608_01735 [Albitalea sp.]|nr:hypothetical protein [Albitalea sp.]HJW10834.1 hypothetical protein [Albitalea sp.]
MPLADISPNYELVQEGGRVSVSASLGYRYNLATAVRLSGTDSMTLVSGVQSVALAATDEMRLSYAAFLDGQAPTPTVAVDFVRAGTAHRSTVTIPAAFTITSPTGPANLTLSAGQLLVEVSTLASELLVTRADGSCVRTDDSRFDVHGISAAAGLVGAVPAGSSYRVDAPTLDANLGYVSTAGGSVTAAKVASCDLTVTWRRETRGTAAATMHPFGHILGVTLQRMSLHYDAMS